MLKIFKRKKDGPGIAFSIWEKISALMERRKRQVAGYLNRKTATYSKRKWTLMLFIFCVAFGGSSVFVLMDSMAGTVSGEIKTDHISEPAMVYQHQILDSLADFEMWKQYYRDSINQQAKYGKQDK